MSVSGEEKFDVSLFKLYDADEELSPDIGDDEESSGVPYKSLLLPSRGLHKLWEKCVVSEIELSREWR